MNIIKRAVEDYLLSPLGVLLLNMAFWVAIFMLLVDLGVIQ